jgi:hypothetical protein
MTITLWLLVILGATLFCARRMYETSLIPGTSVFKKIARFMLSFCLVLVCAVVGLFIRGYLMNRYTAYEQAKINAENLRRQHQFVPATADLATQLTYLCEAKRSPCVIDFTAPSLCDLNPDTVSWNAETMGANLDRFVSACPMYRWERDGEIFVVQPRKQSDSSLNVQVGPVRGSFETSGLLANLCTAAHFPWEGVSTPMGLRSANPKFQPPEEAPAPVGDFTLPRGPFIKDLIRAAKQSGHSYWLVQRHPPDPRMSYQGALYHCRTEDLNSKKRYISLLK